MKSFTHCKSLKLVKWEEDLGNTGYPDWDLGSDVTDQDLGSYVTDQDQD